VAKKRAREIHINSLWCKSCGICVAFCQPGVLQAGRDGVPQVRGLEACTLCMLCELRCPDFAVVVIEEKEVSTAHAAAAAHAG
jgi:2-oxoglutarate ferredoxin oxidoreductase subunit delta